MQKGKHNNRLKKKHSMFTQVFTKFDHKLFLNSLHESKDEAIAEFLPFFLMKMTQTL